MNSSRSRRVSFLVGMVAKPRPKHLRTRRTEASQLRPRGNSSSIAFPEWAQQSDPHCGPSAFSRGWKIMIRAPQFAPSKNLHAAPGDRPVPTLNFRGLTSHALRNAAPRIEEKEPQIRDFEVSNAHAFVSCIQSCQTGAWFSAPSNYGLDRRHDK